MVGGRGEKWVKPEGNKKVEKVQRSPPHPVVRQPAQGHSVCGLHGSHPVCLLDMR